MKKIILLILYLSLSGCALFGGDSGISNNWTLERLYTEAKQSMLRSNYTRAIELYEFLETRYPFGVFGQQALLDLSYAYYKIGNAEQALATSDRFIRLYPQNPDVDYAYYLQGLINFNKNKGALDRVFPTDVSKRDVTAYYAAFRHFSELLERFPESKYAEDAAQRMVYLRNILAENELYIASYYLRRGAYVAAVNRAKHVVTSFARTPSVPDALIIMAKAYQIMELGDLASDTMRILRNNYPTHPGIEEIEGIALN
jgi:outer membrane protein assembly factor BamD